jgi:hypothetical protein
VSATINATTADDTTTIANNEDPMHSFLVAHGLDSLSLTTAWRWMQLLGFQYDTRKKSFYVDGHECERLLRVETSFADSISPNSNLTAAVDAFSCRRRKRQLEQYTLDGRKNPVTGQVNLQSLLRHVFANCNDFKDKETALG